MHKTRYLEFILLSRCVNETRIKGIFCSTWPVLMRFIAYSTVSELLALGTDGKYRRKQSVKSSAAEHLGFLCFREQHYLWIDFIFFFAPSELFVITDG